MSDPEIGMPPKKILVISFSQSGQLREIVSSLLAPLRKNPWVDIVDEVLKPATPFPFPWSVYQFLDVFPESYLEIPCALEALGSDPNEHFDLVIIAYQVWYLSPSIPICSFLQSREANAILRNKPVVTIVGARNMWYRAHERVKEYLRAADACLIGHIVLTDKAANLVSVVTTVAWMLSGQRGRLLGLFPKPGVSDDDIRRCSVFGTLIAQALSQPTAPNIQSSLNQAAGGRVVPHLLFLEKAGCRVFDIWSNLIRRKGGYGDSSRKGRLRLFGLYLACAIVLLSPFTFLLFYLVLPFRFPAVKHEIKSVYEY
jgi:hypothetical protein